MQPDIFKDGGFKTRLKKQNKQIKKKESLANLILKRPEVEAYLLPLAHALLSQGENASFSVHYHTLLTFIW